MKVILDSLLRVQDVPGDILKQIKTELTLKNPEYIKKLRMGLNRWACGSDKIELWSKVDGKEEYTLPRGFYSRLYEITQGEFELQDDRITFDKMPYPQRPNLRDYQYPALDSARDWEQGIIIMPCGAGKTETALAIAAELGQPTLWITHTIDLLTQSMERAKARLGLKGYQVGTIQGDNMKLGSHMTFATVQTLAKRDLSEIRKMFGCIIIDECHMVFKDAGKARMFESVISQFPARYRVGVTASEYRSDGLISTMFRVIGPKIYQVGQAQLNAAGNVMIPRVEFIETGFRYEDETDENGEKKNFSYQTAIAAMREDYERDGYIYRPMSEVEDSDYCLVLGNSLEHLSNLQAYAVKCLKKPAAFVSGETPKREREQIMHDMREGKYNFLFATYQLAKLGLDNPRLNKLILATPTKDRTTIQQAVGRIMRPMPGKPIPVVYDIWDVKVDKLRYWGRDRVKEYRELGCQIIGGPKVRR